MGINLKNILKNIDDFNLNINLEVKNGELVSLLGPSGCGKTTTLRIIAGFEHQDQGELFIADQASKTMMIMLGALGLFDGRFFPLRMVGA